VLNVVSKLPLRVAAAQSTDLELVRHKHLAAAQAWENVAGQRQFVEKKRAQRQTDINRLAAST
jgi:hypothetical protein